MYTFFKRRVTGNKSLWRSPMWNMIDGIVEDNVETVIKYYRMFPSYLESSHIFTKIIDSLPVCKDDESLPDYIRRVEVMAQALASSLGFTSGLNKGRMFVEGVMFKKGTREFVVSVMDDFDVFKVHENWQTLQPIKHLHHELTDMSIPLLKGKHSNYTGEVDDIGFNVITIDIPLFAAQYECWRRATRNVSAGMRWNSSNYLVAYPLANAIYSYVDYAVFNRLKCITRDIFIEPYNRTHPFVINSNIVGRLDKVLKDISAILKTNRKLDFQNILRMIPVPYDGNMWDALSVPDVPNSRQIEWVLEIARLPAIDWLVEMDNSSLNTQTMSQLRLSIRDLRSDNVFTNYMNPVSALLVYRMINRIYNKIKR